MALIQTVADPVFANCMIPAVSNLVLRNSSQSRTLSVIKSKGRKAIHYQLDSAILHKEMKLFFPLNQVADAVDDYELFPRPWFKAISTIASGSRCCTIPKAEIRTSSGVCSQPELCNMSHLHSKIDSSSAVKSRRVLL